MIYTIKPLEWEGNISEEYGRLTARTPFGSYNIIKTEEPEDYDSPFHLHYCFVEYYDDGVFPADSVEHAKELAWQDWTNRLGSALTVYATRTTPEISVQNITAEDIYASLAPKDYPT